MPTVNYGPVEESRACSRRSPPGRTATAQSLPHQSSGWGLERVRRGHRAHRVVPLGVGGWVGPAFQGWTASLQSMEDLAEGGFRWKEGEWAVGGGGCDTRLGGCRRIPAPPSTLAPSCDRGKVYPGRKVRLSLSSTRPCCPATPFMTHRFHSNVLYSACYSKRRLTIPYPRPSGSTCHGVSAGVQTMFRPVPPRECHLHSKGKNPSACAASLWSTRTRRLVMCPAQQLGWCLSHSPQVTPLARLPSSLHQGQTLVSVPEDPGSERL